LMSKLSTLRRVLLQVDFSERALLQVVPRRGNPAAVSFARRPFAKSWCSIP
jgi:hypothetical protein